MVSHIRPTWPGIQLTFLTKSYWRKQYLASSFRVIKFFHPCTTSCQKDAYKLFRRAGLVRNDKRKKKLTHPLSQPLPPSRRPNGRAQMAPRVELCTLCTQCTCVIYTTGLSGGKKTFFSPYFRKKGPRVAA